MTPSHGPTEEPAIVRRARAHPERAALAAPEGLFTYRDLLERSGALAGTLLELLAQRSDGDPEGIRDGDGSPAVLLVPPGFRYAVAQWGIWRAGAMAVPLGLSHPARELAYALDDAGSRAVIASPETVDTIRPLAEERGLPVLELGAAGEDAGSPGRPPDGDPDGPHPSPRPALPPVPETAAALMLYTSGTTGRPKGVVHTHASLRAQIESLTEAWAWRPDDHILLVLPLHHVHGIVNVLSCALWNGACCQILPAFDAVEVWERFARTDLTLFMAVPTIYHRLIAAWEGADPETRERWSEGARGLRLMVSGSAALPVRVLERWREITGHTLLERYGMTEIGMGLSNPLEEEGRRPGHVGTPLPGVEARLVDGNDRSVEAGEPGEIQIRGPGLFREYWRRPEATAEAFTPDGWFRTGDVAVVEEGDFRILGRRSVDIINTGGHKVSALEVEEVLRTHPAVEECAVVGVPDPEWGERVAAAVVPRDGADPSALETETLRGWARERLAPYKAPSLVRTVDALPRNAMGKVTKPRVAELFGEDP